MLSKGLVLIVLRVREGAFSAPVRGCCLFSGAGKSPLLFKLDGRLGGVGALFLVVKAGRDDGNAYLVVHRPRRTCAEDDLRPMGPA